jgi:hypothetical protein
MRPPREPQPVPDLDLTQRNLSDQRLPIEEY